jgi:L-asparaginase
MSGRPKVAVIGTGGTISSFGRGPFDTQDYVALGDMGDAARIIDTFRAVHELAELVPVAFPPVPSTQIAWSEWAALAETVERMGALDPDLAGFVILHGTATMEETAYALDLTLRTDRTVVLTGAQRPSSALSADGGMNLAAAIRTASAPEARGLGVLLVLNDEIHAAREVSKTSVWRLQTFRTPDFGVLGHVDGDAVAIYRRPVRARGGVPAFDRALLDDPPRVDVAYAYAGADGTAVRAFAAAGAEGIVSAGLAPGLTPPAEWEALAEAAASGIAVVQSSRAGSGRTVAMTRHRKAGILPADNLTPQKARILLALALASGADRAGVARLFAEC